jgi:hypothetical protein
MGGRARPVITDGIMAMTIAASDFAADMGRVMA